MPELPEVEAVRRGLVPRPDRPPSRSGGGPAGRLARSVSRKLCDQAEQAARDCGTSPAGEVSACRSRWRRDAGCPYGHVGPFKRRARLRGRGQSRGASPRGRMQAEETPAGKHDHVVFHTDDGTRIVFTDHRRFGLMLLAKTAELDRHELFAGLGPEPLDNSFTPRTVGFADRGQTHTNQSGAAGPACGCGLRNIILCEALFRARISPKRLARSGRGGPRGAPGPRDQGGP